MFPSSAATVTTEETLEEAHVAILSFLKVHPNTPILVACTKGCVDYLTKVSPLVSAYPVELHKPERVTEHNQYHRKDAIAQKMDILKIGIEKHRDCLFFDADLIFYSPLNPPEQDSQVCLSLNLSQTPDMGFTAHKYGMFNAGLVWSRSLQFVEFWKSQYLNPPTPDSFYEQSALSRVPNLFRTDIFQNQHNYGFWRGVVGKRPTASIHCHLMNKVGMTPWMENSVKHLRTVAFNRMPFEFAKQVRQILGHPRKIFFAHYGKAGGVYTNIAMKGVLAGYRKFDSWSPPFSLEADWEGSELERIIKEEDMAYLHQHHVNITDDQIKLAKDNGWTIVCLYRDPRDLICSLYYWSEKLIMETGYDYVFGEEKAYPDDFNTFFDRLISSEKGKERFLLPTWMDQVDYSGVFSLKKVDEIFNQLVGQAHIPHGTKNASGNPGWEKALTKDHLEKLELIPRFRESVEWVKARLTTS